MAGAGSRDLRIDALRGLALVLIFIDHVPGNPLALFTLQKLSFSDAAELFVFLAGVSAAWAFGGVLQRQGLPALVGRVAARVKTLFLCHLGMIAVLLGLFVLVDPADWVWDSYHLRPLREDSGRVAIHAALLHYQPGFLDILPVYMVLLASTPALLLLVRRWGSLALLPPVALYLAAGAGDWSIPAYPDRSWFFNPLRWQLLFAIGLVAAYLARFWNWRPRRRWWFDHLAWGVLAFGLIARAPWTPWWDVRLVPADWLDGVGKSSLDAWRLASVLAQVYLLARWVPAGARWLHHPAVSVLVAMGRNSLPVFAGGTLLAIAFHLLALRWELSMVPILLLTLSGVLFQAGFALRMTYGRPMPAPPLTPVGER